MHVLLIKSELINVSLFAKQLININDDQPRFHRALPRLSSVCALFVSVSDYMRRRSAAYSDLCYFSAEEIKQKIKYLQVFSGRIA